VKIKGTGVPGHTFGVGAETCANCHREMVHARGDMAALEQEVERLKAVAPESLLSDLEHLKKENGNLKESLRANRAVFTIIASVTFVLGLFLGYPLWHRRRKPAEGAK
jgi:hypothetical protein